MASPNNPVVTLSFWRDDESDDIRTCIYQDSPDYRRSGDCGLLTDDEVLELLGIVGLSEGDRKALLKEIPENKPIRRQFKLEPDQETQIREKFFSANW